MKFKLSIAALTFLAFSCQTNTTENSAAVGTDGWLEGTTEERLDEVAHQLGGFSRTMVEVGYRYSELYWAGMDENWGYADHQIEHIIEAMEDGLKRRPVRAESSKSFMEENLPQMEELIKTENQEEFLKGFQTFTSACNACHAKEGESAIMIQIPEQRLSPVRF